MQAHGVDPASVDVRMATFDEIVFFEALPDLPATHRSADLIDRTWRPGRRSRSTAARYDRQRELLLY